MQTEHCFIVFVFNGKRKFLLIRKNISVKLCFNRKYVINFTSTVYDHIIIIVLFIIKNPDGFISVYFLYYILCDTKQQEGNKIKDPTSCNSVYQKHSIFIQSQFKSIASW